MVELFRSPQILPATGFYFEEPETETGTKISTRVILVWAAALTAAGFVVYLGIKEIGGFGDTEYVLGTDRDAGEDESGRGTRDREGGRNREAAERKGREVAEEIERRESERMKSERKGKEVAEEIERRESERKDKDGKDD